MPENNFKNIFIALFLSVFVLIVSFYFVSQNEINESGLIASISGVDVMGNETKIDPNMDLINKLTLQLIEATSILEKISLDTSILSGGEFTSLKDFSKELPVDNLGRDNPFAPL